MLRFSQFIDVLFNTLQRSDRNLRHSPAYVMPDIIYIYMINKMKIYKMFSLNAEKKKKRERNFDVMINRKYI